jgi:hypothetical protein
MVALSLFMPLAAHAAVEPLWRFNGGSRLPRARATVAAAKVHLAQPITSALELSGYSGLINGLTDRGVKLGTATRRRLTAQARLVDESSPFSETHERGRPVNVGPSSSLITLLDALGRNAKLEHPGYELRYTRQRNGQSLGPFQYHLHRLH